MIHYNFNRQKQKKSFLNLISTVKNKKVCSTLGHRLGSPNIIRKFRLVIPGILRVNFSHSPLKWFVLLYYRMKSRAINVWNYKCLYHKSRAGGIFTQNGYFINDGYIYIAEEFNGITPEEYRVHAAPKGRRFSCQN